MEFSRVVDWPFVIEGVMRDGRLIPNTVSCMMTSYRLTADGAVLEKYPDDSSRKISAAE